MYFSHKNQSLPIEQNLVNILSVQLENDVSVDHTISTSVDLNIGDFFIQVYLLPSAVVPCKLRHILNVQSYKIFELSLQRIDLLYHN